MTTLFWGAGATLQFLVLAWADSNLGLDLSKAAILQGVVAIGIAIGAVLAAAYVSLRRSVDVLPIGVLMGFSVAVMSFIKLPGSRAASTSSASISPLLLRLPACC